ncbi:unnamed protein product, partial [Rotaria sp. Silwood2]
ISRIRESREVLHMFPLFYSITIHFDKVSIRGRYQTVEILLRYKKISDDRCFHLNIVKMLSSLLDEYIIRFVNDQSNKSSDFDNICTKKAENSGKSISTSDALRDKYLKGLCDILRSHIKSP